jgi:hypothetical protein
VRQGYGRDDSSELCMRQSLETKRDICAQSKTRRGRGSHTSEGKDVGKELSREVRSPGSHPGGMAPPWGYQVGEQMQGFNVESHGILEHAGFGREWERSGMKCDFLSKNRSERLCIH